MPDSAQALVERLTNVGSELTTVERIGVDAVHIPTWERHISIGGQALLARTYRPAEILFSAGRIERLSSRLAGKEAVLKVLGTGIRGVGLREVEIVSMSCGRPTVVLHNRARAEAEAIGLQRIEISLCHEQDYAFGFAAGVGETDR
jgi:holo-[acyl-carrier protein] synthase